MLYSSMGILLIVVKIASSMKCPGCSVSDSLIESFNDTAVSDFVLKESGSVARLMDCAVMCANDIRCRSYRHNVLTKTCSTYGAGYSLPEKTINTVTAEAGSRLYAMCGAFKSFGSSCSTDADCDFANSACLSSSCSCELGFSYDVWTGDCLERCATHAYGDLFTPYPKAKSVGCNVRSMEGLTQLGCMEACRDEVNFTCINAEYFNGDDHACRMCDTAWYDLDPADRETNIDRNWVLWNRHCGYTY